MFKALGLENFSRKDYWRILRQVFPVMAFGWSVSFLMALAIGLGFNGPLKALNTIVVFAYWPVVLTVGVVDFYIREEREKLRSDKEDRDNDK
jgi:hypothetical protein